MVAQVRRKIPPASRHTRLPTPDISFNRANRLADAFTAATEGDLYRQLVSAPEGPAAVVPGACERSDPLQDAMATAALSNLMERMSALVRARCANTLRARTTTTVAVVHLDVPSSGDDIRRLSP